jgi:hypothetical protein
LQPSLHHLSQLGFWVGTGGFGHPIALLQAGLNIHVNVQSLGEFPISSAFLGDCTGVGCTAQFNKPLAVPVAPGNVCTVTLRYVPVVHGGSLFGYRLDMQLVLTTATGRVIDRVSGRLYAPTRVPQRSVEAIVEAMAIRGHATALPNGRWHANVSWHVRLNNPWPAGARRSSNLLHVVATGGYPRKKYGTNYPLVTHLTTQSLHLFRTGEAGQGTVSYDDELSQ